MRKEFLWLFKDKRSIAVSIVSLISILAILFIVFGSMHFAVGTTAVNSSKANLTIWDTTDSATRFTYQNCYDTYGGKCLQKSLSEYNVSFYANFTNKTSGEVITPDGGNCSIRFDENLSGVFTSWVNMTFASPRNQYEYSRRFNYRGGIPFEINCTNATYSNVNSSENATISNTGPAFHAKDAGGNLPVQNVVEDTLFYYNVSLNCSDDDLNDIPDLVFNYTAAETTLTNFTLSAKGNLTVNISTNADVGSGSKKIMFTCTDSLAPIEAANMSFTITAVNDAPRFVNLNDTLNITKKQFFNFTLQANDEEGNAPYAFNATFINCTNANWSTRNSTNCNLFNLTSYNSTAVIINFTPSNNDVGNYTVEFNVSDAGTPNASSTRTIIFSVINTNDPPVFTGYICGNGSTGTEDANFFCFVTANDTDESFNLTFSTNITWFTFNNSRTTFTGNISSNTSAQINFTANDSSVGVWYVNISVVDTAGGTASSVINVNFSNVNDSVASGQIDNNFGSYVLAAFYLQVNASDDDLRIPRQGKSCTTGCYNESLSFEANITNLTGGTYGVNTTLFRIRKNTTAGGAETIAGGNVSFADISFVPSQSDTGNYTINITVRDANNYSISSRIFNLTVYPNNAPYWLSPLTTNFTFSEGSFTLNLYSNATDGDGDVITFTDSTALFDINASGYISISNATGNDSNVGQHTFNITLTDARGATNSTAQFGFAIKNINETPILFNIPDAAASEDTLKTINFSAIDEDLYLTTTYSATDFYPENLRWNISSSTINVSRLSFTQIGNTSASISFIPSKSDLGAHVINISVNDSTERMDSQTFTLIVSGINHAPLFDYTGSPMNATLNSSNNFSCAECIDINVSDVEDGNDSLPNSNFSFVSNETWFKISNGTGKVNFTVGSAHVKANGWWINVTVYDVGLTGVGNLSNSTLFHLMIYENNVPPIITRVAPTFQANTVENATNLLFFVTVSDANAKLPNSDVLNVTWKIDGAINKTETGVTNGSSSQWYYYTNFTDETTNSTAHNVSVYLYDSQNAFTLISWNVTVNHTNAPPEFRGTINNQTISGTSYVNITCYFGVDSGSCDSGGTSYSNQGYFVDTDHSDQKYNDSVNLTFHVLNSYCNVTQNSSTILVSLNNETLVATFHTTTSAAECFNITIGDKNNPEYNKTSNNFLFNLTVNPPGVTTAIVPSGGGGGSSKSKTKPVMLKIIVPEPVSMFTLGKIVVPIKLQNRGQTDLKGIRITAMATLAGIRTELEKDYFGELAVGKEEKFDMTVLSDANAKGSYEIIINATVESPAYSDTASFFVNLIEMGWQEKIKAQEKIIFLEELLVGNPECLELKELLNDAKKSFDEGDFKKSLELADKAIEACKYAVSSKGKVIQVKRTFGVNNFILIFTASLLAFLLLLFIFNSYKRARFKRSE
jgi:hypothetical protein